VNAAPAFAAYSAAIGVLAPWAIVRSKWPQRAPLLAVVAWHALAVSFSIAAVLAAYHVAVPAESLHAGVGGAPGACWLVLDMDDAHGAAGALATVVPVCVLALLLGRFAAEVLRARRARSRHLEVLDVVGRRSPALGVTVLAHTTPVAYCLPGRSPRVVVSEGALRLLSAEQLAAVLEHERAHIVGRHHLAVAATEAFARVFGWLPLGRHAREQTALLLEMAADDRALRRHPREILAAAVYEMAAGATPRGGFAAGGKNALVRLQRLLTPQKGPHPALVGLLTAVAVTVPVLPLFAACSPS
jgi:Zn-dependent protease with chaperone function